MNDADQFIVKGSTIKALAQAWDDLDKMDFFAALDECKAGLLPENSIAILYQGSGGEIMMRSIKKDELEIITHPESDQETIDREMQKTVAVMEGATFMGWKKRDET